MRDQGRTAVSGIDGDSVIGSVIEVSPLQPSSTHGPRRAELGGRRCWTGGVVNTGDTGASLTAARDEWIWAHHRTCYLAVAR